MPRLGSSQLLANVLMPLPVSTCFLKYRVLLHRRHHRCRGRRLPLLQRRWKTLKIRVIPGGRGALLPPLHPSASSSSSCGISKRAKRSDRPAFTAIYRSISYVDWVRGGFSRVLRLARLRHRVATTNSLGPPPRSRPTTEVDRARNALATRFCLKGEFHSRIRLM